jgi:hypothetical protein
MSKGKSTRGVPKQEWEPAEMECRVCHQTKPIIEFSVRWANQRQPKAKGFRTGTSGRTTLCSVCHAIDKKWYFRRKRLEKMSPEQLKAEREDLVAQLRLVSEVQRKKEGDK